MVRVRTIRKEKEKKGEVSVPLLSHRQDGGKEKRGCPRISEERLQAIFGGKENPPSLLSSSVGRGGGGRIK